MISVGCVNRCFKGQGLAKLNQGISGSVYLQKFIFKLSFIILTNNM